MTPRRCYYYVLKCCLLQLSSLILCEIILKTWFKGSIFSIVFPELKQSLYYRKGESISLYVKKLTSVDSFFTIDYYKIFPYTLFSANDTHANFTYKKWNENNKNVKLYYNDNDKNNEINENIPKLKCMNIGQQIIDDCIRKSPINNIIVGENKYCIELGINIMDYKIWDSVIKSNYYHNWILDKQFDETEYTYNQFNKHNNDEIINKNTKRKQRLHIGPSFPLGFVKIYNAGQKESMIYNHFRIVINIKTTSSIRTNDPLYRVINFDVIPNSHPHYYNSDMNRIIPHCNMQYEENPSISTFANRSTDLLYDLSWKQQPSRGPVLFTYDVIWNDHKLNETYSENVIVNQKYLHFDNNHNTIRNLFIISILTFVPCYIIMKVWSKKKFSCINSILYSTVFSSKYIYKTSKRTKSNLSFLPIFHRKVGRIIRKNIFLIQNGMQLIYQIFPFPIQTTHFVITLCGTAAHLLATIFSITIFISLSVYQASIDNGTFITLVLHMFTVSSVVGGYITALLASECNVSKSTRIKNVVTAATRYYFTFFMTCLTASTLPAILAVTLTFFNMVANHLHPTIFKYKLFCDQHVLYGINISYLFVIHLCLSHIGCLIGFFERKNKGKEVAYADGLSS